MITRYLSGDRIPPRLVWEHVKDEIQVTPKGYVLFDDTVLDKRHAQRLRWCGVNIAAMPKGSSTASGSSRAFKSRSIGSFSLTIAFMTLTGMAKPS